MTGTQRSNESSTAWPRSRPRLAGDGFSVSWVEPLIRDLSRPCTDACRSAALLRGVAGAPVRPESYARARSWQAGVGPEQAPPRREFDGTPAFRR